MTPRLSLLVSVFTSVSAGAVCMQVPLSQASDFVLHQRQVSAPLPLSKAPPAHLKEKQTPKSGTFADSKRLTVFVNFDGGNLVGGSFDSSDQNVTQIIELSGQYPPYEGGDLERALLLDSVREDWKDFNVNIVSERPTNGDYIMCMVGEKDHPFGQGVLGIAPLDCENANPSSIVFSFVGKPYSSDFEATVISQEVAHALGLEHVHNEDDIMNAYAGGSFNPTFVNECTPINGDNFCESQHSTHCEGAQQNAYAELLYLFGEAIEGDDPPEVAIDSPADGTRWDSADSFAVEVSADDDVGISRVELLIDGSLYSSKTDSPYRWEIDGLEAGEHQLVARAVDSANNSTMSLPISIRLDTDQEDSGSLSGGGDTGGPTTATGGNENGDADEGATIQETGEDEGGAIVPRQPRNISQDGAGCALARPSPPVSLWLFTLIIGGIAMAPTRRFGHTRARD